MKSSWRRWWPQWRRWGAHWRTCLRCSPTSRVLGGEASSRLSAAAAAAVDASHVRLGTGGGRHRRRSGLACLGHKRRLWWQMCADCVRTCAVDAIVRVTNRELGASLDAGDTLTGGAGWLSREFIRDSPVRRVSIAWALCRTRERYGLTTTVGCMECNTGHFLCHAACHQKAGVGASSRNAQ